MSITVLVAVSITEIEFQFTTYTLLLAESNASPCGELSPTAIVSIISRVASALLIPAGTNINEAIKEANKIVFVLFMLFLDIQSRLNPLCIKVILNVR